MNFPTPKVVVSKCLGFDSCRYNGQKVFDPVVQLLSGHVKFITTCPEVEIGLDVPRNPVRLVREKEKTILFQPASGIEVTGEMETYLHNFFSEIGTVDGPQIPITFLRTLAGKTLQQQNRTELSG